MTAAQRKLVDVTEAEWQRQVTDLAEQLGWSWAHFRAAQNRRGVWSVPVAGPLGKGWPDLFLVRERDQRMLFLELKRETGNLDVDQARIVEVLRSVADVLVVRPHDLERLAAVLR